MTLTWFEFMEETETEGIKREEKEKEFKHDIFEIKESLNTFHGTSTTDPEFEGMQILLKKLLAEISNYKEKSKKSSKLKHEKSLTLEDLEKMDTSKMSLDEKIRHENYTVHLQTKRMMKRNNKKEK